MVPSILAASKRDDPLSPLASDAGEASIDNLDKTRFANGTTPTAKMRIEMQKIMQTHAAVFRTGKTLQVLGCHCMVLGNAGNPLFGCRKESKSFKTSTRTRRTCVFRTEDSSGTLT